MSEIKGYRTLSDYEITLINHFKILEKKLLKEIDDAFREPDRPYYPSSQYEGRWVSICKTHIEQGFMALCRAIAKPEEF